MRHVQGVDREQVTFLPDRLEDYVSADHPARVIDAFVDRLDMKTLGFGKAIPKATGRKPYSPADLLRLYIYGYLNQVRSSRKLERECQRNIELMWLMRRLAPDFKTIANFRKEHPEAITEASRRFVQFCRHAGIVTDRQIAIDGSKFKAVASKDGAYTAKQLAKAKDQAEQRITRYLEKLEEADNNDESTELDRSRTEAALQRLKDRKQTLDVLEEEMIQRGDRQICAHEADARLMRSGRDGIVVGYNVQSAVDADSGIIVHHDITQKASDNQQLEPMSAQVKADSDKETLEVVADAGYSNGAQLNACDDNGISATVPPNRSVNNQGDFYQKADFEYDEENNHYTCPAGKILKQTGQDRRNQHWLYSRQGCSECPIQAQCTKADKRTVTRHFHEAAFARSKARLKANPEAMLQRMVIAERPFAQLKQNQGVRRYLCRGLSGARSETGLAILGHNLQRACSLVGAVKLQELLVAPA